MNLAGRLPMSMAQSLDARNCVHAQKPYSSDICALIRQSRRKRRKIETGKTEDRRLMERKADQQKLQNKNLSEEIKRRPT